MNRRLFQICLLIATFVAIIPVCLAYDEGPQLVRRAILVRGAEPLAWDKEGSVALIVTGKDSGGTDALSIGAQLWSTAIEETLTENLPDLSDEEIADLTEFLKTSLVGATCIATDGQVKHVATGGVKLPFVYFSSNDGLPAPGAMVDAGPDGNVLVLGEFLLRRKTSADNNFPYFLTGVSNDTWLILGPDVASTAELRMQIAVGTFTK